MSTVPARQASVNLANNGLFVLATHKTLQVTFWTRLRDLVKGMLLYGSVNWRRASDGLKPPRLSPTARKVAMPAKNLDVIRPRENPQAALIKTLPKKAAPPKWDITAGAIVSDPLMGPGMPPPVPPHLLADAPHPGDSREEASEEATLDENGLVVVHRRKRRHRHGTHARRAPRTALNFRDENKPGLLARWFGSR